MQKTCFKCLETKPIDEFYKNRGMLDGHLNKCIPCVKIIERQRRAENVEYWREHDRKRAKLPHRIEAQTEQHKFWRESDKRRARCHSSVARAIRKGILVKMPCEKCGDEKSVAHHEDYDKPLEVMWLCQPCHVKRHQEINGTLLELT